MGGSSREFYLSPSFSEVITDLLALGKNPFGDLHFQITPLCVTTLNTGFILCSECVGIDASAQFFVAFGALTNEMLAPADREAVPSAAGSFTFLGDA